MGGGGGTATESGEQKWGWLGTLGDILVLTDL